MLLDEVDTITLKENGNCYEVKWFMKFACIFPVLNEKKIPRNIGKTQANFTN